MTEIDLGLQTYGSPMGRTPRKLRYYSFKTNRLPGPRYIWFLRPDFWSQEAKLILGREISIKGIVQIEMATCRYASDMEYTYNRFDVTSVAKACRKILKAIKAFRDAHDAAVGEPAAGKLIREVITSPMLQDMTNGLDDEWLGRLDRARERLSLLLSHCIDPKYSSSANPWDEWVRRVAAILQDEGFKPTAFSYESRNDRREPTPFVRLITQLQADLPEWVAQHEPEYAGHPWFSISKAVVRALRGANG